MLYGKFAGLGARGLSWQGALMLNLRCTRKLLDRFPVAPAPENTASTTVLGDWYATILLVRPAHLVLLVNERSRLPVVLPAREMATLLDRIPSAVAVTLLDLEVPPRVIEREFDAMRALQCTPTRSRSVVGTMNEFVFQIRVRREEGPLPDLRILNHELGRVLVGIGRRGYECPADEARRLLVS